MPRYNFQYAVLFMMMLARSPKCRHFHAHERPTHARQVYRALEKQRLATEGSSEPLPPRATGGFPRAEFFTSTMPQLPPHLASSSQYDIGDGAAGGGASGGGGGSGVHDVLVDSALEAGCPVNVLAMERLGDNLMSLSQVRVGVDVVDGYMCLV